jgi:hypothetical protein
MGTAQRALGATRKVILSPGITNGPGQYTPPSHPPSTPTKTSGTYIPEPQSQRILQRYVNGQSIRSIARAEQRDRATITKVVRSTEMQEYVTNMKERFVGLGSAAMDALEHALIVEKDSRLAHLVLRDIGVIPTIGQEIQPANQEPMGDEDARVRQTMIKMASVAIERNRVFKTPLPNLEAAEKEIEQELSRQREKQS